MIELLLAVGIITLACLGLAAGLLLKGRPLQTSCEASACLGKGNCAICPNRNRAAGRDKND